MDEELERDQDGKQWKWKGVWCALMVQGGGGGELSVSWETVGGKGLIVRAHWARDKGWYGATRWSRVDDHCNEDWLCAALCGASRRMMLGYCAADATRKQS